MSEIKVGEYVRTKEYGIRKVINENRDCFLFDKIVINENLTGTRRDCAWLKSDIRLQKIEHNPNIIDLIEVGDYVNGILITGKEGTLLYTDIKGIDNSVYHIPISQYEENIESIVTKEQFEKAEYKIEKGVE